MKTTRYAAWTLVVIVLTVTRHLAGQQEIELSDGWAEQRDAQSTVVVRTKELSVYPRAEPRPALKHRLVPDAFEQLDGNAAVYYLKATGFFEQDSARSRIARFEKEEAARARKDGVDVGQAPPFVWLETAPNKLPLKEVGEYLQWLSFQPPLLREAARRSHYDLDRQIRTVDNPLAYLLPEVQTLRELARNQRIRCRYAIAQGRIDDAIEITGQQFALARHLGDDDFLVSNLVGVAIAGIAWDDALYLVQHRETPNLYWALASLPKPLVRLDRSLSFESQLPYQQIKVLREVDETPRPPGYWQNFVDRLIPQFGLLQSDLTGRESDDREASRAAIVGFVAAAYPGARRYLIDELKLPRERVAAYPTAQVVFLAMVRFYDQARDDVFKWSHVPFWQRRTFEDSNGLSKKLRTASDRYGWCTAPTSLLLPAVASIGVAEARLQQSIAMLQTVEAIRMYAAAHDGELPTSLADLPVPAPIEPFTGQPIQYERLPDRAIVTGHSAARPQNRLVLRIAAD